MRLACTYYSSTGAWRTQTQTPKKPQKAKQGPKQPGNNRKGGAIKPPSMQCQSTHVCLTHTLHQTRKIIRISCSTTKLTINSNLKCVPKCAAHIIANTTAVLPTTVLVNKSRECNFSSAIYTTAIRCHNNYEGCFIGG